jgi:hypothetical protein
MARLFIVGLQLIVFLIQQIPCCLLPCYNLLVKLSSSCCKLHTPLPIGARLIQGICCCSTERIDDVLEALVSVTVSGSSSWAISLRSSPLVDK